MKLGGESNRRERVIQVAVVLLIIGGLIAFSQLAPDISLQSTLNDVASKLGKLTYLHRRASRRSSRPRRSSGWCCPGRRSSSSAGPSPGRARRRSSSRSGSSGSARPPATRSASCSAGGSDAASSCVTGPKVRITHERFARVEDYFSRHGGKTILIGRFIGLVRALAPFVAGSSGMRYMGFLPYSVLGTGLWSAGYVLLGYFASRSLDAAAHAAGQGTLFFGIAIVAIVGIVWAVRFLRDPANRRRLVAGMEGRPCLRPLVALGRRIQPQARFVLARITPGGLGLEFTTVLAVLAVSVYLVVAYTSTISAHPGPTPGDQAVLDLVDKIQMAWLDSLAKVVTTLGSSAVVLPLAVIAVGLLAWERRWPEAAVIAIAMVIIYVGVAELKALTDRPRPPDPLTGSEGSAFPSGTRPTRCSTRGWR